MATKRPRKTEAELVNQLRELDEKVRSNILSPFAMKSDLISQAPSNSNRNIWARELQEKRNARNKAKSDAKASVAAAAAARAEAARMAAARPVVFHSGIAMGVPVQPIMAHVVVGQPIMARVVGHPPAHPIAAHMPPPAAPKSRHIYPVEQWRRNHPNLKPVQNTVVVNGITYSVQGKVDRQQNKAVISYRYAPNPPPDIKHKFENVRSSLSARLQAGKVKLTQLLANYASSAGPSTIHPPMVVNAPRFNASGSPPKRHHSPLPPRASPVAAAVVDELDSNDPVPIKIRAAHKRNSPPQQNGTATNPFVLD